MFHFFRNMKRMLSFQVNRAEEPEETLQNYVKEMGQTISQAEDSTTKMFAEQKRLTKQITQTTEKLNKRKEQAFAAMEAGNDDFAKRVLEDKAMIKKEITYFVALQAKTTEQLNELQKRLKQMKVEHQELKLKMESLNRKADIAQYDVRFNTSKPSDFRTNGSKKELEDLSNNTNHIEAKHSSITPGEMDSMEHENEVNEEFRQMKEIIKQKSERG